MQELSEESVQMVNRNAAGLQSQVVDLNLENMRLREADSKVKVLRERLQVLPEHVVGMVLTVGVRSAGDGGEASSAGGDGP